MNEEKSKLELIGMIAEANNKNLELIEETNKLEDEIERLKNRIYDLIKDCNQYVLENDRLNNIINELEEWIKEDKEYAMKNFECGRCFNMFDILNKIKELKKRVIKNE